MAKDEQRETKPSQQDIIEKVKAEAAAKKAPEKADATVKKDSEVKDADPSLEPNEEPAKVEKPTPTNEDLPDEDPDAALKKIEDEADAAEADAKALYNETQRKVINKRAKDIINSDMDANTDDGEVGKKSAGPIDASDSKLSSKDKQERGNAAAAKLRAIVLDFSPAVPDEHVVFGRAGIKYTVGDLRDLFALRQ